MKITRFDPAVVPEPIGQYCQALEVKGDHRQLFISGQIPEARDGEVPNDFEGQCEQVWTNISAILESAGMTIENLVKVTTFLTSRTQAEPNSRIRRQFLDEHRPALTVVVAETLDPRWMLEIEAIAVGEV